MGEVLYRKYRSRTLDEVVGQEHITTTLKNALKTDQISHAYLFTGPRGVGKTSIARILAREVNKLPYSDDQHLDIIEIDAASNRRIDEIRDLRDKVHIAPTSAKYKVYIIDEVHMLTKEAFNALLKTLEEPPAHVIFILATTDFHKLPDTIVSRTQRFAFKPITVNKAVGHLRELASKENIKVDDEALKLIAKHGDGSFRDSISILDTIKSTSKEIQTKDVMNLLGIPADEELNDLFDSINSGNLSNLNVQLQKFIDSGYHSTQIAKIIINKCHQLLTDGKTSPLAYTQLNDLLKIGHSHDPTQALEIVLIEAALGNSNKPLEPKQPENVIVETSNEVEVSETIDDVTKEEIKEIKEPTQQIEKIEDTSEVWTEVLKLLKGKHNTLYGVARMAEAKIVDETITLSFKFPFHQRRCNENHNKQILHELAHKLTGIDYKISCVLINNTLTEEEEPKKVAHVPKKSIENVKNIFGGGEVL